MSKTKNKRFLKSKKTAHHIKSTKPDNVDPSSGLRMGVCSGYILPDGEVDWKIFEMPSKFFSGVSSLGSKIRTDVSEKAFNSLLEYHKAGMSVDIGFTAYAAVYLASNKKMINDGAELMKTSSFGIVMLHDDEALTTTTRLMHYDEWKGYVEHVTKGSQIIYKKL
jgi:hypothetical protein